MARRGLCSRREAERLIEAGLVLVDGVVVREQGTKALPDAKIEILPEGGRALAARLTVILHKPAGIVSTQPEPGQTPAWKLIRRDNVRGPVDPATLDRVVADPAGLSVAGRLDRASRGLLVLTQDGTLARLLIGGNAVEKSYLVRTAEPATDGQVRKLNAPMQLDGQPLLPMRVRAAGDSLLRFRLREGKKHQIRRVCRHVGLDVTDLFRESVGPLRIGDLPEGQWRLATEDELARLRGDGDGAYAEPHHRDTEGTEADKKAFDPTRRSGRRVQRA
jgi:23S rRNA pseudouridine2604 synthase